MKHEEENVPNTRKLSSSCFTAGGSYLCSLGTEMDTHSFGPPSPTWIGTNHLLPLFAGGAWRLLLATSPHSHEFSTDGFRWWGAGRVKKSQVVLLKPENRGRQALHRVESSQHVLPGLKWR